MSGIYKNGIVKTSTIIESSSTMLNTFTAHSYTPTTALNSCIERYITGFVKGKSYAVELIVTWNGFKTNASSNFDMWFQGATYSGGSWNWNSVNYLAKALSSICYLKTLVLSVDSGTTYLYNEFTSSGDATGYAIGIRSNYSNGTGTIAYSNLKIAPLDSFVKSRNDGCKISNSKIVMNNCIEL